MDTITINVREGQGWFVCTTSEEYDSLQKKDKRNVGKSDKLTYLCPPIKSNHMKREVFDQYVKRICELFRIDAKELFEKSKKRDVVDARHLLYYLCDRRPMSKSYIIKFMLENGYTIHHSSVIRGISSVENRMGEDADYVSIVKDLERAVFI